MFIKNVEQVNFKTLHILQIKLGVLENFNFNNYKVAIGTQHFYKIIYIYCSYFNA